MTKGIGSPFSNNDLIKHEPLDYFEEIEKIKPLRIYFIRAMTNKTEAFILLKVTDYKFKIFQKTWHISDYVGGGGRLQLLSFYRLINKLRDEGLHSICYGRALESEAFVSLFSGDVFPGNCVNVKEDPWWDDITDIYYDNSAAEKYERWYGKSFIRAQEIIRSQLSGVKFLT